MVVIVAIIAIILVVLVALVAIITTIAIIKVEIGGQANIEVRTKHRGTDTITWNAPVTSKSEKGDLDQKYYYQNIIGYIGSYWNINGIILLILYFHRFSCMASLLLDI